MQLSFARKLQVVDLDQKIGQLIMTGFPQNQEEENLIIQLHIGGIVLGGPQRVLQGFQKRIKSLQQRSKLPLFVAIDQEGGFVSRLNKQNGFSEFPSAKNIGQMKIRDAKKYYREMAILLKRNQINFNLAPVVDLAVNSKNKIIYGLERSYSERSDIVTQFARSFIQEHHQQGVVTTIKHFPGHGSSVADSHVGLVDVSSTWKKDELIPFEQLIKSNDVDVVMTGHLYSKSWDPEYPASLSKLVVTDLLRRQLKYEGVVMSDDLQMRAVSSTYDLKTILKLVLQSGTDIILMPNWTMHVDLKEIHQTIKSLVVTGEVDAKLIEESYQRIIRLKKKYHMIDK